YLRSSPKYEALSYTWGDALDRHSIACEGKTIRVTANLLSALQHLRQPDVTRILWVDAVCINQGNIAERDAQVRMMGDIYRMAARVLVWLG
ncbi:heterokaryon incompatibility, partial [Lineolata rhizophorae]